MTRIDRYKPECIVTFYTEEGDLVARSTKDPKSNVDDDVVSVETTRDMGADSPTFTINLTRHKHWHKWIASNDLVKIEMQRPPEEKRTVMVGIVEDVRKRTSLQGDQVSRQIIITGRGVSKAFIQCEVGIVPEAEYVATDLGWVQAIGITLAGSPASTIMQNIWDIIAKKIINYKFSNGIELFDIMNYNFKDKESLRLLDDSSLMSYQGSLWQFMKEIAEQPFYELFWEIEGTTMLPELIMRPTPFNPDEWSKLMWHQITDEDVVADDTGRSDLETYTLYSVGAKTLFSPQDTYKTFGTLPIWYKPYADKYGIRRLHVESSYLSVADEPGEDVVQRMKDLMIDLYNWNIRNNSFWNGYLVVRGMCRYQVGDRVIYTSDEDNSVREFYVTSVQHNFNYNGAWITKLGVTRGCHPADRYLEPVGKHTEYSGLHLVEFNPAMALENLQGGADEGIDYPMGDEFASGKASDVVTGAKEIMKNGINGHKVVYRFGKNKPNKGWLDCSSFTSYVFRTYAGMEIGRTTGDQVLKGTKVSKKALSPGDLVFFKDTYKSTHIYGVSHVGIYIGNGKFINNSGGEWTGTVKVDDLNDSYWSQYWLMGRRIFQSEEKNASGTGKMYEATAYGAHPVNLGAPPGWNPTYKTATGTTPLEGRTIAVDPKKIPLGSKVRIECSTFPSVNGEYIAEDVGGAIKGNRVDIYFNDIPPKYDPYKAHKRMQSFGRRNIKVTILRRGK